jgi:UDP-3-O-[3-hydroxymyristoyl] glucosamine N-acyltransferase
MAGDPRFFARTGPHDLAALAAAAGAEARGAQRLIHAVAPVRAAGPQDVTFVEGARHRDALAATAAGAVIVPPALAAHVPAGAAALVAAAPYVAWARVCALFHPLPPARPGIHPSAVVDPAAHVDPSAEIGPLVVVGPGAEIGPRCRIGPHAVIGAGVVVGADGRVGAHASISHAILGARVLIHPGARIGQDGFGFTPTPQGFLSIPQLGRVLVHDDVEVGANTTIDRGSAQDTVVGAGTRIDNLVQIGHNCSIGRCCVLVAQVGLSGSCTLEDFVQIGGQGGLAGHLTVGKGARIGAQTGVMSDVPAGATMFGYPALPGRDYMRMIAWARQRMRRGAGEQ